MMKYFFIFIATLLLPVTFSVAGVFREEHIANFQSNIVVNPDTSIDITENITVYARGDQIKQGIVRWLPTQYTDSNHISHPIHYQINKILLNDAPHAYHTNDIDHRFAIYIGENNALLRPGYYLYTLSYHVSGALNLLSDSDELNWNITGNDWALAMLKVTADITLPRGAKFLNHHVNVGERGEHDNHYQAKEMSPNQMVFTADYLEPQQAMTVAIAWPKGWVKAATRKEKITPVFQVNKTHLLLLEVTGALFVYYSFIWLLYGRPPKNAAIIPFFDPPNRLSPAAMRYIMRMGFDMKTLSAAIVDLAAKKFIAIKNDYDDYTLVKASNDDSALSLDEIDLQKELFKEGNTLNLIPANASTLKSARNKFKSALKETYRGAYFKNNLIFLIPGILLTGAAYAIAILGANKPIAAAFSTLWLSVWSIACSMLIIAMMSAWQKMWRNISFTPIVSSIFITIFTFVFLIGLMIGLAVFTTPIEPFTVPTLFFISQLNIVFYQLMKVPTQEGRMLMHQIEGFKLFLSTTERDRLASLNPPKQTPALFEKYLPYAIALDVEKAWGELFNASLRQAGIEPNTYYPTWYSGVWTNQSVSTFPIFLGTGLSNAMASASSTTTSVTWQNQTV